MFGINKYLLGGLSLMLVGSIAVSVFFYNKTLSMQLTIDNLQVENAALQQSLNSQIALNNSQRDAMLILQRTNANLVRQVQEANQLRQAILEGNYEGMDISTSLGAAINLLRRLGACGDSGSVSNP